MLEMQEDGPGIGTASGNRKFLKNGRRTKEKGEGRDEKRMFVEVERFSALEM
jgi:hypothetical protein